MFVVVKHRVKSLGNTLMNSSCDTNSELGRYLTGAEVESNEVQIHMLLYLNRLFRYLHFT